MKYNQRVIIRFLCKERISPEGFHALIEAQFGDATCSERRVRQWFQYLRRECENLRNEVRSSRPPIDLFDIQILALLDEHTLRSANSITESLRVSHSIILSHLWKSLNMKIFHLRWIPHQLTTSLQQIRMETFRELLPILKVQKKDNFKDLPLGTRVASLWNFIIRRNGAYREMLSRKR
jgi:hypothetical protein